jgi:hypothetical protein
VSDGASVRSAARELDALDARLGVSSPPESASSVAAALGAAYSDPRFHQPCAGLNCVRTWLGHRISDTVGTVVTWLYEHASRGLDVPGALTALSIAILLACVVGIGVLARRGAMRRMTVERRAEVPPDDAAVEQEAFALALSARDGGEYRNAFRFIFLWCLLELQSQGVLTLRPGWTNRDHLAHLSLRSSASSSDLNVLVDAFDRVWYGHSTLDAEQYARLEAVAVRLATGEKAIAA